MGGVCSRGFPEEPPPRSVADAHVARRARYGPGDFDSGELAIPPPKPHPPHKVHIYTLLRLHKLCPLMHAPTYLPLSPSIFLPAASRFISHLRSTCATAAKS